VQHLDLRFSELKWGLSSNHFPAPVRMAAPVCHYCCQRFESRGFGDDLSGVVALREAIFREKDPRNTDGPIGQLVNEPVEPGDMIVVWVRQDQRTGSLLTGGQ
jgi:hypothetical protein